MRIWAIAFRMNVDRLRKLTQSRLSIRRIAEIERTSYTNVRYWLRKHGLKVWRGPHGRHRHLGDVPFRCQCGENDPSKFYGHKRFVCGRCHNASVVKQGSERRKWIVDLLGGKCVVCGFDKYLCSLDVHHLDPGEKSKTFASMRYWSKDRITKELERCVLLCSNCHEAVHAGLATL
jgi:hypothetical protein